MDLLTVVVISVFAVYGMMCFICELARMFGGCRGCGEYITIAVENPDQNAEALIRKAMFMHPDSRIAVINCGGDENEEIIRKLSLDYPFVRLIQKPKDI